MKLPVGPGLSVAFWALGGQWPDTEIDIMECAGEPDGTSVAPVTRPE